MLPDTSAATHAALGKHAIDPSLQSLNVPGILTAARKKPQSKQQAFRIGHAPYAAPAVHHPGLQRPLYLTGHFRVEQPAVVAEEGRTPNPDTSFDAVNGPMTLAGEAEWQPDDYIAHAYEAAKLPGNPIILPDF